MSNNTYEHWQDISSYQGTNIDTTGIDGFIVKLSQGTSYVNPVAVEQIELVADAGCKVAFYHFLNSYSPAEIDHAIATFNDIVSKTSVKPEFYAWDIETTQAIDSLPTGAPLMINPFNGLLIAVYTNQSLLGQVNHKLGSLPVWLALPQYVPPAEIPTEVASEESKNNVDIIAVQDSQTNGVDNDYVNVADTGTIPLLSDW